VFWRGRDQCREKTKMEEEALPFSGEDHIPFGSLSKNAPFVESPISVLREACNLLQIQPGEVVYDLGCGTADFLLCAANSVPNIEAVGIDIAQDLVDKGNQLAADARLMENSTVQCKVGNVFEDTEWQHRADKIFMYLVPRMLKQQKFQEMLHDFLQSKTSSGQKKLLVCYHYSLPGWEPVYVDERLRLYLYSSASMLRE
jgi:SAM-dependent methyltransferase